KAYFNSDVLGIDMNAGYQIKATNPVYLIYEATATDDEHNLLGL
ncbi:MAG: hypothetical protein ACJAT7_003607, partial [Psychromonas sp.]